MHTSRPHKHPLVAQNWIWRSRGEFKVLLIRSTISNYEHGQLSFSLTRYKKLVLPSVLRIKSHPCHSLSVSNIDTQLVSAKICACCQSLKSRSSRQNCESVAGYQQYCRNICLSFQVAYENSSSNAFSKSLLEAQGTASSAAAAPAGCRCLRPREGACIWGRHHDPDYRNKMYLDDAALCANVSRQK